VDSERSADARAIVHAIMLRQTTQGCTAPPGMVADEKSEPPTPGRADAVRRV